MSRGRVVTSLAAGVVLMTASGCGEEDKPSRESERPRANPAVILPAGAERAGAVRPKVALADLPAVRRPEKGAEPSIVGLSNLPAGITFVRRAFGDVASFRSELYRRAGAQFPATKGVYVNQPVRTACRNVVTPQTENAFYCGGDETIYVTPAFHRLVRSVDDAPAAVVIAHEFGHRVQHVAGILGRRDLRSRQIELQADCLSGLWLSSVYRRALLERGDLEAAAGVTFKVGDRPGMDPSDPQAHGSGQERVDWLARGFRSGTTSGCPIPR